MGTVPTCPPRAGPREELDARTDLFSFGAVLYEMATGRVAFFRANLSHHLSRHSRTHSRESQRREFESPVPLDEMVSKALEKDRPRVTKAPPKSRRPQRSSATRNPRSSPPPPTAVVPTRKRMSLATKVTIIFGSVVLRRMVLTLFAQRGLQELH